MTMVPIGDVAEVKGGGTPSKRKPEYYEGDIPWVTPKDMKVWDISDAIDKITPEAVADSATNLIPARSVLLVNRSGILKHTLPVGITRREVAINQDLKALICSDRAHPEYLAHIVKAAEPIILTWVRATTADNFPIDSLKELKIPLPTLDEQRRIAGILDQADALRRLRTRALGKLNTLGQAIFHEMFEEALQGDFFEFGQAVEEFRYGTSNKSGEAGLPTLRIPNVIGGGIDTAEIKTVEVTGAELVRLRLRDGDVLFVRTNGNPDYVGRCAAFSFAAVADYDADADWIFASYLIRARLSDRINPAFAKTYFASQVGRSAVRERCKTSAGQYNINTEGLASLPFPDVPRADQDKFAEVLAAIEQNSAPMKRSAAKMNEKFASLQYRAFNGEL